jgi:hypothetical protein
LIKIKQRISWYSPQLQPWPHLRRDAQAIRDAAEFREFWLRGVERIESLGDAGGGSASSLADAPAVDHANEAALL